MNTRAIVPGRVAGAVMIALCGLALAGCVAEPARSAGETPAIVAVDDADGSKQISLTAKAAQRLGIVTAKVSGATVAGKAHKAVPYAALFYDASGAAWVYTNPQPLVYKRAAVVVDRIVADLVIINEGPELETPVVIVGVAELYGVEVGVGK